MTPPPRPAAVEQAADLLHRLHVRGVRVSLADDDPAAVEVSVEGDGILADDDLAEARRLKPAILRLLETVEMLNAVEGRSRRDGPV